MIKNIILLKLVFLILFSVSINSLFAQESTDKIKNEISETLKSWNMAAKNADVNQAMSLFDTTATIILIGSDSGEVYKGKEQIKKWLGQLFEVGSFSWEMNRIDIDNNGNTAWVFMDGKMIVNFHNGKRKITPYRFTGIMVRKKGEWKWRLFDGSVPKGE
ncbi:MAG: nuclear transport factor 2 family protein [Bacteroidetes bacterium]|nr:nuclear transport factor 2 family protein [Bacteroidota bacterium]